MAASAPSSPSPGGRRRKATGTLGGINRKAGGRANRAPSRSATAILKKFRPRPPKSSRSSKSSKSVGVSILPTVPTKRRGRFGLGGSSKQQRQPATGYDALTGANNLPAEDGVAGGDGAEASLGQPPVSINGVDVLVSPSSPTVSSPSNESDTTVQRSDNRTEDEEGAVTHVLVDQRTEADSTSIAAEEEEEEDFDEKDKDMDSIASDEADVSLDGTISYPYPTESEDFISNDIIHHVEEGADITDAVNEGRERETPPQEELVAISSQGQDQTAPPDTTSPNTITSTGGTSDNDNDVSNTNQVLRRGVAVRVTTKSGKSKYEGMVGRISSTTAKQVYVTFPGIAKDPRLPKSSVEIIDSSGVGDAAGASEVTTSTEGIIDDEAEVATAAPPNLEERANLKPEQYVNVIGGTYKGHQGIIVNVTDVMVSVDIVGLGKKTILQKSVQTIAVDEVVAVDPTSSRLDNMQVEIPLNCNSGVSSCISLATGIVTPTSQASTGNESPVSSSSPNSGALSDQSRSGIFSSPFSDFTVGQQVFIERGKHKGKTARVTKILPQSVKGVDLVDNAVVTARKKSIQGYCPSSSSNTLSPRSVLSAITASTNASSKTKVSIRSSSGDEWRVADSQDGGTRFGSRFIQKMRLTTTARKADDTFLSHILGNRIHIAEIPLNAEEATTPFEITIQDNGYRYELVSVKVREDGDSPNLQYCKKQCAHLIYVQVQGPRLEPIMLEDMLQDIADFSSLDPRKVMARLELLQSPAFKLPNKDPGIFFLDASDICEIEDNGNDGCGFICEKYLFELLGSKTYAKATLAIQVRVFANGVFKGMLMRKRNVEGPRIQLTPTMKKVLSSPTNRLSGRACLVITQAGRHPNPVNGYIGRMLDPSLKPPPKSFNNLIKPLNKHPKEKNKSMIPRLFQALGVPREASNDYANKSKKMTGLNHAYVVGVADPTEALPPGHVFVTGFNHVRTPKDEIFITRSPCIKASDARMVPLVTNKPNSMSEEDWDWLLGLPFGAVIFANPNKGFEPLPAQIAKGDLDGDNYFICWSSELIQHMRTDPAVQVRLKEKEKKSSTTSQRENWLEEAQQMMVNSVAIQELGALTGELYNLSGEMADESPLFMRDPDAIAFADAYNQALEFGKHGGKISLPLHLHDKVSGRLRSHLSA